MGGFFGAALKEDCVFDLFYGTDYHSHLGTRRAGMAVYSDTKGFDRAIHNIESSYFRPKFEGDLKSMEGNLGIGCISDYESQPLVIRSHLGTYAITTVGKINNIDEIAAMLSSFGRQHFMEMSGGGINPTELVATIINQKDSFAAGIRYAQELIKGSMTILVMVKDGIYAARDRYGRTPVEMGKKDSGYCVCFESFSFLNLGYEPEKELQPGEVVFITPDGYETVAEPFKDKKVCSFLWIYYGFPASTYEGLNVENTRYDCGRALAKRDITRGIHTDIVAGVPDSGVAHAVGYSNESGIPYTRPFVKYTPTWPRSFMPTYQEKRNLIAKMKLIPIHDLIGGRSMLLIDDSIVRGTQLRETTEYLFQNGAKEVHIRPACPPLVFGCPYLNFSRSNSEMELITRRTIEKLEGTATPDESILQKYVDPDSEEYANMLEEIRKELKFTSLHYHRLDDMLEAIDMPSCELCTYCWNGKG
ncbi:MAG: amidophosphoribosyltransferase [Lachnospiraceae bacterium]|nr:amidophosphoribosyltransferase [Lachnospiraceae bacterium]